MSQRRSTTPLFELLDSAKPIEPLPTPQAAPTPAAQPDSAPSPHANPSTPAPARTSPVGVQPAPEPKPLLTEGVGRPALVGRLIVLPVPFALIGLGVLVVIAAVLWATAWNMGDRRARAEEQAKFTAMGGSRIVDPIGTTGTGQQPSPNDTPSNAPPSNDTPPVAPPFSNNADQTPSGRPVLPAGAHGDPRQDGFNYLRLATLERAQAREGVDRLIAGGVDAFMVPLESSRSGGNNTARPASRFVVYLAQGFPGGREFSSSRRDREQLVSRAKRIGEAWAKDGGPTGFQEPFWDKYVP